jgi:hypothetical protein
MENFTMKGPKFLGQPSPALRKMHYLTPDELRDYIVRLQVEKDRIAVRLAARQKAGATTDHDKSAARLERRLDGLMEQARRYWAAQGGGGHDGNETPRAVQGGGNRGGNVAPSSFQQKPTLSSRYQGGRF